ncbi:hypothetical protein COV11_00755, partial [Candidatus Woesearchaeota archaeon CG10_big_fil_rev_8_21_14_0_10_30_7]
PKIQLFHQEQRRRNEQLENLISNLLDRSYSAEGIDPQYVMELNNVLFDLRREQEVTQKRIEQLGLFEYSELRQEQLNALQQLRNQAKQLVNSANKAHAVASNLRNKLSPEEQKIFDELIKNVETLSSELHSAQNKPSELQQNLYLVPPINTADLTQEQLAQKAKELKQKSLNAEDKLKKLRREQLTATEEKKPSLEKQIILAEEILNELENQSDLVNAALPAELTQVLIEKDVFEQVNRALRRGNFETAKTELNNLKKLELITESEFNEQKETINSAEEKEQIKSRLAQLNWELSGKPKITIYTKTGCPGCEALKKHLVDQGIDYEELDVSRPENKAKAIEYLVAKGYTSVPIININGEDVALQNFGKDWKGFTEAITSTIEETKGTTKLSTEEERQAKEELTKLSAKLAELENIPEKTEEPTLDQEAPQCEGGVCTIPGLAPTLEAPIELSLEERAELLSGDVAVIIQILESTAVNLPSNILSSTQELMSFIVNVQRSNAEARELFEQGELRAYLEKLFEGTLAQALGIVNALIDSPRANEFTTEQIEQLKQLNSVIRKTRSDVQELFEQAPIKIEEEKRVEETSEERARRAREQLTQNLDQTIEGIIPVYAFNQPLNGEYGGDLIFTTSPKTGTIRVLHLDATGHGELGAKHKAGLAIAIQRLESKLKTGELGRTLYEDLEFYLKTLQEEIAQVKNELKQQGLSEEELAEYDPLGTFAAYDYNTETGEVTYSTGGEEKNFFHYTEGKVGAALKSRGQKLGEEGIKTDTTQMKTGDVFVIVSDGVTDIIKSKDLKKLIEENAHLTEQEIKQAIQNKYKENKEKLSTEEQEKLSDDISIVIMKAKTEKSVMKELTQQVVESLNKDCKATASVGCTINFGELESNVDYFKDGVERLRLEQGIEKVMQQSGFKKEFTDQPWLKSLSTKNNDLSIVINAKGTDAQAILELLKDQKRSEDFWQALVSIPLLRKHLQINELSSPELEDTKTIEEIKQTEDPKILAEQKGKEFAQKYNLPFIEATSLEEGRIIGRGRNKELTSILINGKEYVPQTWGVDELELKLMVALKNLPNSAKLLGITIITQQFRDETFYVPVMLVELVQVNGQPAKNLLDAKEELSPDFFDKLDNAIKQAHKIKILTGKGEQKLFHGDLIERNVLIDENGNPVLIDWTFTRLGLNDITEGQKRDLETLQTFKELHGWKIKKEITTLEELIQTDCGAGGSVGCTFDYTNTKINQEILNKYLMTEQNRKEITKAAEEVIEFLSGVYNVGLIKLFEKEQPGKWIKDVIFEGSEIKIIINTKTDNAEKIIELIKDKLSSEQLWNALVPFDLLLYADIMRSEDLIKNIQVKLDDLSDEEPIIIRTYEQVSISRIPEKDIVNLETILEQTEATFEQLIDRNIPVGQQVGKATKLGQGRFGLAWKVNDKVLKVLDIEDNDALSSASTISDTGLTPEYDFVSDEYLTGQVVLNDDRFIQVEKVVKGNSELIQQGEKLIQEGRELLNSLQSLDLLQERLKNREISSKEYLQLFKERKENEAKANFLKNKGEYLINLAKKGSGLIAIISKYYEGQSLDVLRDRQETLPISTVSNLEQILNEALTEIHEGKEKNGKTVFLTHEDIKPANIMIQPDGIPVILDLGVSKIHSDKDDFNYVIGVFKDNWRKYITLNRARAMQDFTSLEGNEFENWYVNELRKIIEEYNSLNEEIMGMESDSKINFPFDILKKEVLASREGTIAILKAKTILAGKLTAEQHKELLKQAESLE